MNPISLKGYLVLDKIKDGSVGTVWLARDGRGHEFALKQLGPQHASDSSQVRQFEKEARLTQKLDHPGIIKVHDYVAHKPQPFFVMEYFVSENLKVVLARFPERLHKREFQVLMKVADALAHVHSRGLIHKDVKPENVLVSASGDVRLIDFSLASTRWDRLLHFGRKVQGTPLYMAPEQIRGERGDARTDVYAFGVMMYELLAKRPPFLADNPAKILEKHLREKPASLRSIAPAISAQLDAFVLRLLAKDPAARPADMTAVLHEITRWIKKDTVTRLQQVVSKPLQYPKAQEVPSTV